MTLPKMNGNLTLPPWKILLFFFYMALEIKQVNIDDKNKV